MIPGVSVTNYRRTITKLRIVSKLNASLADLSFPITAIIDPQKELYFDKTDFSVLQQTGNNWSSTTMFLLLGFGNHPELQVPLFLSFLTIYTVSIFGNLLIVFLVAIDQHLHTPMYFFLMNLSCLETCYITTTVPRMLASLVTGDRSISMKGCITQYYFFGSLAATECYLLAMMSYDRYLAICKPLHYTTIMSGRLCIQLACTSWSIGLMANTVVTALVLDLTFCGPNEIDHYFCDLYPVTNLSCSNTHLVKLTTFILSLIATGAPFGLTLASYVCIIMTILQIKSRAVQQKAFSTCSSHLIVVSLFYGSLFLVYVVPETDTLMISQKSFSLFYTVLTPMLNPLIYSLRNREVKQALFRYVRKLRNQM
ncbi:olfactory receptor 10A7-like [Tiliqua scincoides]|uniref:olfactory receptor 10A7-like n=1 Tax=Tiliqua scincoides TaxID=71010 RepID=UPI0034620AA9